MSLGIRTSPWRPPSAITHHCSPPIARLSDSAEAGPSAGLPEREDPSVSGSLPLDALLAYVEAVFAATTTWLDDVGTMALDTVPDSSRRLTDKADLSVDDVDWLHRMWTDKPVWWLVQWPIIGHGHAHVGEAISIRNRMGLSPF